MSSEFNNTYSYLEECQKNWGKLTYRMWWLTRAYLEVSRKIDLPKGSQILSVGSGMGQLEYFLNKRFGYNVICLDINPYALQTGRYLFGENRSVVANGIQSLPFPDNSMDFILSYDFMEHLPDESAADIAFSEMERVVKNRGVRMLHKITVTEEQEAIDSDTTHHIKWSAYEWRQWFEERGWGTQKPTCHRIPIWSREKIGLYPVEGAFYLEKFS